MTAVIKLDIPDYQIGQEVSVYFKDTMCIKGVCQGDSTIEELEKIKGRLEVAMWYNRRDKEYCLELIDKRISELKGENNGK